ncbi:glucosamine inositolphosphorylceramide transferase family protein [Commensalibacter oyaizuii]|uniref:Formyl transferase n=1 Tax=Commensalibacter oyaizuii TaxID=3043873 RepID=A0ABT6Q1M0_9PROT|nr:formyl transferase [Commensalibacter sp. TBRC 16381]MDI2091011.1 formyl transferase [Commensalibacter sp. TBRC 16381]
MSIFETDIWRLGIIKAPIHEVISKQEVQHVYWLDEEPKLKFLADPFGLYKNNKLYIFAEAYDYRNRHGYIELLVFNHLLQLLDRRPVLQEPWHLSYPMIIEDRGEIYMLPEAYKSGKTTLYKAIEFPYRWEKVKQFNFPEIVIDPTVTFYQGLWWMFYTSADSGYSRQGNLSVAYTDDLMGSWSLHPSNPVRITPFSARPGGNAVVTKKGIILPTQNCTRTYGGSLSFLQITTLTPNSFEAHVVGSLKTNTIFDSYRNGIHTLSAAGDYTLIDAKQIIKRPFHRLITDSNYYVKRCIKSPVF